MGPITSVMLNVIGVALQVLGAAILFFDLRGNKVQEHVRNIQIHMGKLKQTIDDMNQNPIPKGSGSIKGQDLSEMWKITADAGKEAQKANEKIFIELLKKVGDETDKNKRAEKMAIFLVLVGGLLQLVALQI